MIHDYLKRFAEFLLKEIEIAPGDMCEVYDVFPEHTYTGMFLEYEWKVYDYKTCCNHVKLFFIFIVGNQRKTFEFLCTDLTMDDKIDEKRINFRTQIKRIAE